MSNEYLNRIINSDCLSGLKTLPDNSIHCCVTSPPYYGLRDYGMEGQMGLEGTPEAFIAGMVEVFREVKRVLKSDGTLWVNIGDSYAASGKRRTEEQACKKSKLGGKKGQISCKDQPNKITGDLKPKDLIGIPWMLAFALRADGWYLRQDIIWAKPNPMPESVNDRCTKSHEYIFMLSKSSKYYYNYEAIKTKSLTDDNRPPGVVRNRIYNYDSKENNNPEAYLKPKTDRQRGHSRRHSGFNDRWDLMTTEEQCSLGANKRSVWNVATKPFSEAHFATFPETLIVDCIKAGCPENGLVLDPFMGAGTTAIVSSKLNRNYVGFELNPAYIQIANKRIDNTLGLFKAS